MAKRLINGKDYVVMKDNGSGDYEPIVCLTSHSFNRTRDKIEAKTKCGDYTVSGTLSYTLDVEGVVMVAPDSGEVVVDDLEDLISNDTYTNWKIGKVTPTTGDVSYAFSGYLLSLNQTFGNDAAASFTASISVDTPTVEKTVH